MVTIICWQERDRDVLDGIHSPSVAYCLTFRGFLLCLIVFTQCIFTEGYDWRYFEYISKCIIDI